MKRLVEKFGKVITASFFVMGIGIILFLLTPLFYGQWGIDTDLIGLTILTTGVAILLIGIICRNKLHGWKFVILAILAGIMSIPIIMLIVTSIIYLITGKPIGS
ncbi:MAG: hypothetical protein NTV42_06000 [Chloroflexi bacterium]|nr:hypothetical protein [Chloroflexota bacterium]